MLFEDLKALVAVIDSNSITGAAETLCLTQSAISRRIQHLEGVLDAALFDRSSKPPRATAMAHRIYRHAVPLLRDARYLLDIPRGEAAPVGQFRLGLTQLVADVVLVDTVTRMKAEFPALEMQIRTDWSDDLQDKIAAGTLDAATVMLPAPSSVPAGLAGTLLCKLDMHIVQSKAKPMVKPKAGIRTLAAKEWILNPSGCVSRGALERLLSQHGASLRLVADTQGSDMQLRLVAAGLGLGLVSEATLRLSRYRPELTVVRAADFALALDIWLVHPPQLGNLGQAARSLADCMKQAFVHPT